MKATRLALLGLFAVVGATAHAIPFFAASLGSYTTAALGYTTSESVIAELDPLANPVSLSFTATYVGLGVTGTAIYSDGLGSFLTLSFAAAGPFNFNSSLTTSSIAGTWSFVSGTGAYSTIASGTGTWSATYSILLDNKSQTTFMGEFEPVPEPASIAALAIGVVAIARRRRRSAK